MGAENLNAVNNSGIVVAEISEEQRKQLFGDPDAPVPQGVIVARTELDPVIHGDGSGNPVVVAKKPPKSTIPTGRLAQAALMAMSALPLETAIYKSDQPGTTRRIVGGQSIHTVQAIAKDRQEKAKQGMRPIKRNDPCPCGSGKKWKKCCINKQE